MRIEVTMATKADLGHATRECLPAGEQLFGVALYVMIEYVRGEKVCEIRRSGPGCLSSALRAAIRRRGFRYVDRLVEYNEVQWLAVFGRGHENRKSA